MRVFYVTVATVPPSLERMQSVAKLPEDVGFLDAKAREAAAAKARLELAAEIKRKRLQTAKNRVFVMGLGLSRPGFRGLSQAQARPAVVYYNLYIMLGSAGGGLLQFIHYVYLSLGRPTVHWADLHEPTYIGPTYIDLHLARAS